MSFIHEKLLGSLKCLKASPMTLYNDSIFKSLVKYQNLFFFSNKYRDCIKIRLVLFFLEKFSTHDESLAVQKSSLNSDFTYPSQTLLKICSLIKIKLHIS